MTAPRKKRSIAGTALLVPESWAPEVVEKLRANQPLDEWQRNATAELLERASEAGKKIGKRGRKPKPHQDSLIFDIVERMLKDARFRGAKLTRDGIYKEASELFGFGSPSTFEKAHARERRRRNSGI